MMKKIIFFTLLNLFSLLVEAKDYYSLTYKVRPNDTFAEILKKFVKNNAVINAETDLIKKIQRRNSPKIDWRHLTPGTDIQLYIDPANFDIKKYKIYEQLVMKDIDASKIRFENKTFSSDKRFKFSFYYMPSSGFFNQTLGLVHIGFKQNSLLTLGTSWVYYPEESFTSTSLGIYGSSFTSLYSGLANEEKKIPPEIGVNLYEEFRLAKKGTTVYGGLDYEKFSTLDLTALAPETSLILSKNNIWYLSAGFSKSITFSNKTLLLKTTISQSFKSSNSLSTNYYHGNKILFYVNYKMNDKLFVHSLIKYHTMSGIDKLTALRIGVGFGYIFF
jgi:hypothetical protein